MYPCWCLTPCNEIGGRVMRVVSVMVSEGRGSLVRKDRRGMRESGGGVGNGAREDFR